MDLVFKALADPTRRALLDELFGQDGQTLVALHSKFDMTRGGVAKHLGLLQDAGLVVAKRQGREKRHYLNAVPILLIRDRWVSKYTEAWAAALVGLKKELEISIEKVFDLHPHHAGTAEDTGVYSVIGYAFDAPSGRADRARRPVRRPGGVDVRLRRLPAAGPVLLQGTGLHEARSLGLWSFWGSALMCLAVLGVSLLVVLLLDQLVLWRVPALAGGLTRRDH